MAREGKTIYQSARFTTDFTQESAAELLHKSVDSIRAYENGETIPPDYVVNAMIELYRTNWLAYQHLKLNNEVGKKYLPEIQIRQLSASILDLQVEMNHTSAIQIDIAEVGRDNRVDKHEKHKWSDCMVKLNSLVGAAFSVLFAPETKEKSPVLAHRRFG